MGSKFNNIGCIYLSRLELRVDHDKTAEQNIQIPTKAHTVTRLNGILRLDADWDKTQWQAVLPITLDQCCWEASGHSPHTQVKLMYDDENLYVIFKVDDQYVRCVHEDNQSSVCQDSCVEFFFTPGEDIEQGYFNVETNCGGTILFRHQIARNINEIHILDTDLSRIEIAHSLPTPISEEMEEPVVWTLEYKVPLDILSKYAPMVKPRFGEPTFINARITHPTPTGCPGR